jgi:hypothetical protein
MEQQHEVIKRKTSEPAERSFEALRNEGIGLLQALSGNIWTDYNLHDPGVTILEQLCFALTELGYRADFPVADHLTDENRDIDWKQQSLHRPEVIFPCRPTTASDYRALLLDKVEDLDDVFISTAGRQTDAGTRVSQDASTRTDTDEGTASIAEIGGVYGLTVRLRTTRPEREDNRRDTQSDHEKSRIKNVLSVYRVHRNLCEDVDEKVVSTVGALCELGGEIDIDGPRDPIDILAEIYDCCDQHVAGKPGLATLEEMEASGKSLDELFDAPDTQLRLSATENNDQDIQVSLSLGKLRASIAAISGVQQVRQLALADTEGSRLINGNAYRLQLPDRKAGRKVALFKRGVRLEVAARDVKTRFEDLRRQQRQRVRVIDRVLRAWPMPQGQYRNVWPYYSLQNDLPAIYGVNAHGIPRSATPVEKGRAKQLKAYLVLLEQIIANSTYNLQHVRELFSADTASRKSYWWQLLGKESVQDITAVFQVRAVISNKLDEIERLEEERNNAILDSKEELDRKIKLLAEEVEDGKRFGIEEWVRREIEREIYPEFDDYPNRKGRVLDHLLGLYGERLPQNSLRGFADYYDPGELEYALVEHKAALLENIVEWTRDRASGFDYSVPSWNKPPPREGESSNCSGLQLRIGQLLGFERNYSRSLTSWLRKLPRTVDSAEPGASETKHADGAENLTRVLMKAGIWPDDAQELREMRGDLVRIRPIQSRNLSKTLLRTGTNKDRYWFEYRRDRQERLLLLELDDEDQADDSRQFWKLGQFPDEQSAKRAARHLRTFLIRLNRECEGSHLIEHVLLRPTDGRSAAVDPWFFSHRLTVVFPNWTARFQQRAFRRLAEETVQLNCPAHLRARCVWMDFESMHAFEECYEAWLTAKIAYCDRPEDRETRTAVDAAATKIIDRIETYWPSEQT